MGSSPTGGSEQHQVCSKLKAKLWIDYLGDEASVDSLDNLVNWKDNVFLRAFSHGGRGRAVIAPDCESGFGGFDSRRSPDSWHLFGQRI